MAPEQARGMRDQVGARSDIWAVGATLFTLLSGQHVHLGETTHAKVLAQRDQARAFPARGGARRSQRGRERHRSRAQVRARRALGRTPRRCARRMRWARVGWADRRGSRRASNPPRRSKRRRRSRFRRRARRQTRRRAPRRAQRREHQGASRAQRGRCGARASRRRALRRATCPPISVRSPRIRRGPLDAAAVASSYSVAPDSVAAAARSGRDHRAQSLDRPWRRLGALEPVHAWRAARVPMVLPSGRPRVLGFVIGGVALLVTAALGVPRRVPGAASRGDGTDARRPARPSRRPRRPTPSSRRCRRRRTRTPPPAHVVGRHPDPLRA